MTKEILSQHRNVWNAKPVLRAIYHDFYKRMIAEFIPGTVLEVGGGSGNFKEFYPAAYSTDIVETPWVDQVCDAQKLPFADGFFSNIVGIDILHHIEKPKVFLREAQRVLKPGGRLILLEPGMTPLSYVFYKLFHAEPVDLSADPFFDGLPRPDKKPFDSNQAIPELVFGKYRDRFNAEVPGLRLLKKKYFAIWAYPLSGGFQEWSLLPLFLSEFVINIEKKLEPVLAPLLGFKILISIEKSIR